jgi:phage/plasmid-associated DNA primase
MLHQLHMNAWMVKHMHNKRFVLATEPEDSQKINTSTLKEITGGNSINARMAHSNNTKTDLKLTFVLECNNKPKLDNVNEAVSRRLLEIPFQSRFVDRQTYDELSEEEKKTTFLGNVYYKSLEFQMEFRQALFSILLKYFKIYRKQGLVEPAIVRKKNLDYMALSDDIFEWVNDEYDQTENVKDVIKVKDVYDLYRSSEYYQNLTKAEKRNNSYKYFVTNKIENNFFLKKRYILDRKGVMCLTHYKEKPDDEQELDYV